MNWLNVKKKDDGSFVIPQRWLHIHYYEALNILFRYENSLRVLVYLVLKNKYFDKWAECSFGESDESQSISSIAKKRISQAQIFGYLGYEVSCPIMHLTSGELVEIITSNAYWALFKPYFKGSKEIIKTKFLEINTVRNSLAHFRPIKEDDINLLKQNTNHTLMGVEEYLIEAITCNNVVPTNTVDDWYKSIKLVGAEPTGVNIFQSPNGGWIRVQLSYSPAVLQQRSWGPSYISFRLTSIKTPQIIINFATLSKYATYLTEGTSYAQIEEGNLKRCVKFVNFIFRLPILQAHHEEIQKDMKKLVLQIGEETELITQDNLAVGKLVEPVSTTARIVESGETKYWRFDNQPLKVPVAPDDPPEYWEEVDSIGDFISGAYVYPWMQAHVSDRELPF